LSKKPKTRIFVVSDGEEKEVIVARDRYDEGIVFTGGHSKYWLTAVDERIEIGEQHYSIHPSNGGRDMAVTQKTLLANGERRSNVAYVKGETERPMLWPIYARRIPVFIDTPVMQRRQRDRVICIADFATASANLIYSVFVSDIAVALPIDPLFESNAFEIPFERYKLLVINSYINVPSLNEGDLAGASTSSEIINDARAQDHQQMNGRPMPISLIVPMHFDLVRRLQHRLLDRLVKLLGPDNKIWPSVASRLQVVTLEPLLRAGDLPSGPAPDPSDSTPT